MNIEQKEAKRVEWFALLKKGGGEINPVDFFRNARRKASAFHDDYTWDEEQAIKEYYEKRTANLIMHYSTVFNVTTAHQRLHGVRPMLPSGKRARRKAYRTPSLIEENQDQLDQKRREIWSRLRRVTRDMFDFQASLPEFKEILDFLLPVVQARGTDESRGAAAN